MFELIGPDPTEFGVLCLPNPGSRYIYPHGMPKSAPKTILWENVLALMLEHFGKENLSRLAREAGIGQGSTTRIKDQETAVGLDVLENIAALFKVEPWQLLTAHLGAHLHTVEGNRVVPIRIANSAPNKPPEEPPPRGGLNYKGRLPAVSKRGKRGPTKRRGGKNDS